MTDFVKCIFPLLNYFSFWLYPHRKMLSKCLSILYFWIWNHRIVFSLVSCWKYIWLNLTQATVTHSFTSRTKAPKSYEIRSADSFILALISVHFIKSNGNPMPQWLHNYTLIKEMQSSNFCIREPTWLNDLYKMVSCVIIYNLHCIA